MADEAPSGKKVDKIGAFPKNYDTDALPERRTAAFARMMAIVAVVEGFAIIAQGFALAALMPLQKVIPMVVTGNDKGNEVVHINPASLASPTVDYVSEIALRDYVRKRYSIVGNAAEQAVNWGQGSTVQLMSTADAYKTFMGQATPEYERLRAINTIRTVRIDSVRKLGDHRNEQGKQIFTWQVSYSTVDQAETSPMQGAAPAARQGWVSTYDLTYEEKNVTYNDRLNNPFGVTVVSVNDARVD